jgi:uncharacterized protein YuzE
MNHQLQFQYDDIADVLYVSKGHPDHTDYVEVNDDLILRLDPVTKEVVGFTIIDFVGRFAKHAPPLTIPLKTTFERAMPTRKPKVIAESKPIYKVKRSRRAARSYAA